MADGDKPAADIHVPAQEIPAIRFMQWLEIWDSYPSVTNGKWRKPEPYIYLFSMKAGQLRNLSDVYRRKYDGDKPEGVQRAQDTTRTSQIQRYVQFGYPFGDLPAPMRNDTNAHLKKPGWLPTAIVINVLERGASRKGQRVDDRHLVRIQSDGTGAKIIIPQIESTDDDSYLAPFEVIDGQHRLWSFGNDSVSDIPSSFELPVVAFVGLDIAWQAYLFWSINVSPTRINKSHAFDLYPLLRTQEWLEPVGELNVYREARAQELTQLMYTHPSSSWHHRINMLGEKGASSVSQNAWVQSLMRSFLANGRGAATKGLFQANILDGDMPLPWTRSQQGAFLLCFWTEMKREVTAGVRHWWVRQYRGDTKRPFEDRTSLINQDMGLRAIHGVVNDMFVLCVDEWRLSDWRGPRVEDGPFETAAGAALETIQGAPFFPHIASLAKSLAAFDWRSLDGPGVKDPENPDAEILKRSFRGSGGYTALKTEVIKCLVEGGGDIGLAAASLLSVAG